MGKKKVYGPLNIKYQWISINLRYVGVARTAPKDTVYVVPTREPVHLQKKY